MKEEIIGLIIICIIIAILLLHIDYKYQTKMQKIKKPMTKLLRSIIDNSIGNLNSIKYYSDDIKTIATCDSLKTELIKLKNLDNKMLFNNREQIEKIQEQIEKI